MSATKTQRVHNYGYSRVGIIDFTGDATYVAGGYSVTPADFGLTDIIHVAHQQGTAGISFAYDYANQKVLLKSIIRQFTATFDPASLAGTTSRDDAITFTGVLATDLVLAVIPPAAVLASVVVQNCRVTGTDTVTARLTNPSAGAVDVLTGTWTAYVVAANGGAKELAASTDASAITARLVAWGS